jgi:hypothetical protein
MTNYYIYKLKNKLFRLSNEALKVKRPSFEELIKYENFRRSDESKFILSFAAGRSGQDWTAKIFNSHPNWIGTSERFPDFESFYRFISYYNLQIDRERIIKLFNLALKRDLSNYQNAFIGSPYFAFGAEELINRLNPNYIFYNIRNPIYAVESFYRKGWYLYNDRLEQNHIPIINISNNLTRAFSRIIPIGEYYKEWIELTRIGKITWFWATINKAIYKNFKKLDNIDKYYIRLEDVSQNYDFYKKLSEQFNFENPLNKKEFFNVINKSSSKGPEKKYRYKNWSNLEKKEFHKLIDKIFPFYENIKTNI